jgi:hypothetical protein
MSAYELSQLNISIIKAPMDSPPMADFANNLERINRAHGHSVSRVVVGAARPPADSR